jgi:hypothetical protein
LGDPFAFLDSVKKMREGFGVFFAGEEKFRVSRDVEGVFLESEKFQVHGWIIARALGGAMRKSGIFDRF